MTAQPFFSTIHCPHCGRVNDAHSGLAGAEGQTPADGDLGMCWGCREVAVFVVGPLGMAQRLPTPAEAKEFAELPGPRAARAAAAESYRPSQAIDLLARRGGAR